MAVSLEPNQLKKIMHNTSLPNTSLQSYATATISRQLTTAVHKSLEHESLSMDQEPPLLSLNLDSGPAIPDMDTMDSSALSRHEAPDLPTWTPLKTLGDEGDNHGFPISDPEVDELSTGITETTGDTAIKSLQQLPSRARALTVDHPVAGRILKSPTVTESSKRKTARFDGILITTRSPRHGKDRSLTRRREHARTSSAPTLSLVDALSRTFDANRHSEDLPHAGSYRHGDADSVEILTETDDERLRLGARLARTSLKRGLARAGVTAASAVASETNSEDAASLFQGRSERPTKRIKSVPYDSDPAAIDAALGTVEAPMVWVDLFGRDKDDDQVTSPAKSDRVASPNRMVIDESEIGLAQRKVYSSPSTTTGNPPGVTPAWGITRGAFFIPYLSHGAKFRQRLEAIFGENTTVRKDRAVQPRPADLDLFSPFAETDKEPSLDAQSESAASVSAASIPEEGASGISSTHITTQSPNPPASATGVDQLPRNHLNEADHLTLPTFDADEEQMSTWIAALQRLVKGKVRITEQVLEELSIALAEIDSVKDNLNASVSMTSELFGSLKQVSELHEIPFGDRNKLRQRAKNIVHAWPSTEKPGAS